MSEHESRDLPNVDSFSQLPFTRSTSKPAAPPNSVIRLFGFDFPPDPPSSESERGPAEANASAVTDRESSRKFECNYCCRYFPTSQALGGHQNAHKRERQHAKRAHLQSAMAAAHQQHGLIAEGHVYGMLNYQQLGASPFVHHATARRFGLEYPASHPLHYHSWSGSAGVDPRCYVGLGSVFQPINGSLLPGLGRAPNVATGMVAHHNTTIPMACSTFGRDLDSKLKHQIVEITPNNGSAASGGSLPSLSMSSIASASALHLHDMRMCELGTTDHSVSLDLHL